MSFGSAIWNFTEYLCYLAIITQTMLSLWGWVKGGNATSDDGLKSILGEAVGYIGKFTDDFNSTKSGKKSVPASRRK